MGYSTQEVDDLIRKADKAGDAAAVRRLLEYRGQVSAQPAAAQSPWWGDAKPKPRTAMQQAGRGIGMGATAIAEGIGQAVDIPMQFSTAIERGANALVGKGIGAGLDAVGLDGAADWWRRGADINERSLARTPTTSGAVVAANPDVENMDPTARFLSNIAGSMLVPIGPKASIASAPRIPARQAALPYAPGVNADVVEAGTRLRVPVRAPDAIPRVRGQMAKIEASPYGGGKIVDALDADKALMQTRLGEVGGAGAPHQSNYGFGEQIQAAGRRFIESSKGTKNALYKRAESRAGGARVVPEGAIARVDANIAELEGAGANSNSTVINYLRAFVPPTGQRSGVTTR
jgi:hypothetical protein